MKKDNEVLNENKAKKILNYNDDEYILFLSHKNTLTQEYLKARKSLYKTLYEFKKLGFKDLENSYQTYMNSLIINKEVDKDENWEDNQTHSFHLKQEYKNNPTNNKDENLEKESNQNSNNENKSFFNNSFNPNKEYEINQTNNDDKKSNQNFKTKQSKIKDFNLLSYHSKALNHFLAQFNNPLVTIKSFRSK